MKILILGGTRFMGSFLAEQLLERGDDLTLVHRGQTQVHAFDGARHVLLDRADGHAAIPRESWDVVVDVSGYVPGQVYDAVRHLEASAARYVFVSSISAYADVAQPGVTESAPLAQLSAQAADEALADVRSPRSMQTYGEDKALSERVVLDTVGAARSTIVRPGMIVGPRDPTGRFSYWVRRSGEGGEILAPAPADQPVQAIDARDLAAFIVRLIDAEQSGVFNATWPAQPRTFADLVGAEATWVDPHWLIDRGVEPWGSLPFWLGPDPAAAGMLEVDIRKALGAGLAGRDLEQTIADTRAWLAESGAPDADSTLTRARERELLAEWHSRPAARS